MTHARRRPAAFARSAALLLVLCVGACGDPAADDATPGQGVVSPQAPAHQADSDAAASGADISAAAAMASDASAAEAVAGVQRELDRDTVERYLAVVTAMRAADADMTSKLGLDPTSTVTDSAQLGLDGTWKSLLDEHGFDQAGFMHAHGSVALAFSAVIVEQQVEQARSQLPPQQFELMQQALASAAAPLSQVSAANKQLVTELLPQVKQAYDYQGP